MNSTTFPLAVLLLFNICTIPAVNVHAASQEEELLSMLFQDEQLVETTTRSLKPISQVAENVTVVTAQEIAAMRAGSVAEVLQRQPGIHIKHWGQDYLGASSILIQGSHRHHVLVLLDGVRLNLNSGGYALTEFIPVGIIKRIEIIKGAASSTWGSALGGVINIITRDTGTSGRPSGQVSARYGEANSYEIAADAAGRAEALSYYLYAGKLESDGLRFDRYGDRNTVYGKARLELTGRSQLTVSGGFSDPVYKSLNWSDAWGVDGLDAYEELDQENTWGTLFFDTELADALTLHLSAQYYKNNFKTDINSLGTDIGGPYGDLFFRREWDDTRTNISGRLSWNGEAFTANLGVETGQSEIEYASTLGTLFGGPLTFPSPGVSEDITGVYANLTYPSGDWTITPGIRYDYHSNSEGSLNPSIGVTYRLRSDTLLRGSIARGFQAPYVWKSIDSPDLESETVWTYQAGIETTAAPLLHLKTTIFHHDIDDAWNSGNGVPWTNTNSQKITGVELEAKTEPLYGFRLTGNLTFADLDYEGSADPSLEDGETTSANLIAAYENMDYGVRAELAGHYYWMPDQVRNEAAVHGTFLWDLLVAKELELAGTTGEIYLKARNLFNGSQYFDYEYANPDRWVEVGLAFTY